jgi:hypothetical protein
MKWSQRRYLKLAGLLAGALYAIPGLSGCNQIFQANIEALLRPGVIQTGFWYPFTLIGRLFGS